MPTTIRSNVFETNSSSTHSVTIRRPSKEEKRDVPSLTEGGTIFPSGLRYRIATSMECGLSTDGWYLEAKSDVEKLALVLHWVKFSYELSDAQKEEFTQKLLQELDFDAVDWKPLPGDPFEEFTGYCYGDSGSGFRDSDQKRALESLQLFIEWIKDPDVHIIEGENIN